MRKPTRPRATTLAPDRWHTVVMHWRDGKLISVYLDGKRQRHANGLFRVIHSPKAVDRA